MSVIQIGQPAPQFTCTAVVDNLLKEVSLSSYTEATHWVLLLFFPKAWSPICPTEIKAFSDRLEEFLYSRACALLFASTDNVDCLRAWNNTGIMEGGLGGVHMPLIGDTNHRLSRAYGVLSEESGLAQRAFFLIDPNGIIRAISSNDAYVARNVNEVLRLLDALIFKDEFGEGCPADWKKGDQGIDIGKDKVEGVLEIKRSFSNWLRPKLERAITGTGAMQRVASNHSVDAVASTPRMPSSSSSTTPTSPGPTSVPPIGVGSTSIGPTSAYIPVRMPSGQISPMVSPRGGDYFTARPSTSRMEVHLEEDEATMHQKMENMNAALENYRQSRSVPGTPC